MANKRVTRWFVEPRDAATNESAMMDLVRSCGATDDKIFCAKLDHEGEGHDVVEVNHSFVSRMQANAAEFEHRFRVFTQREGENRMRLWPFGNRKKLGQTVGVRQSMQELNDMLKRRGSKM